MLRCTMLLLALLASVDAGAAPSDQPFVYRAGTPVEEVPRGGRIIVDGAGPELPDAVCLRRTPVEIRGVERLDGGWLDALARCSWAAVVLPDLRELTATDAQTLGDSRASLVDLPGLATLDEPSALQLARLGTFTERGPARLHLPGLRQISPGVARALSMSQAQTLDLSGLQQLDVASATHLAAFRGRQLDLGGLQAATLPVVQALGAYDGGGGSRAELRLGGVDTLDLATAKALAQHPRLRLTLVHVTTLTPDGLAVFAESTGPTASILALPALARLPTDVAGALAAVPSVLELPALAELDGDAARALAAHPDTLIVPAVPLRGEVARALLTHPALVHPDLDAVSDALATDLADQDHPVLASAVKLAPPSAKILVEGGATSLTIHLDEGTDPAVTRHLARFAGPLTVRLSRNAEAVVELGAYRGPRLVLLGSPYTVGLLERLAGWEGELLSSPTLDLKTEAIRGLRARRLEYTTDRLDLSQARRLAEFPGATLALPAVQDRKIGGAALVALTRWPGDRLELPGLHTLRPDQALALSRFSGKILDLSGVRALDAAQHALISGSPAEVIWASDLKIEPVEPVVSALHARPTDGPALDPEKARRLVDKAGFKGRSVLTVRAERLGPDAARELARFSGETLDLGEVEVLDVGALEELASFRGHRIDLGSVTHPVDLHPFLRGWRGRSPESYTLVLGARTEPELTGSEPAVVAEPSGLELLRTVDSWRTATTRLQLGDLRSLSIDDARQIGSHRWREVDLSGLRTLDRDLVWALGPSDTHLRLGVVELSPSIAEALAEVEAHTLVLTDLAVIEPDVARTLAPVTADLRLPALRQPSEEVLAALLSDRERRRVTLGIHGTLSVEAARAIHRASAARVELVGVTDFEPGAIEVLDQTRGELVFPGLRRLDDAGVQSFGRVRDTVLRFPDLVLEPAQVLAVEAWSAQRELPAAVVQTDAVTAARLAARSSDVVEVPGGWMTQASARRLARSDARVLVLGSALDAAVCRELADFGGEEIWLRVEPSESCLVGLRGFTGRLRVSGPGASRSTPVSSWLAALAQVHARELVLDRLGLQRTNTLWLLGLYAGDALELHDVVELDEAMAQAFVAFPGELRLPDLREVTSPAMDALRGRAGRTVMQGVRVEDPR